MKSLNCSPDSSNTTISEKLLIENVIFLDLFFGSISKKKLIRNLSFAMGDTC